MTINSGISPKGGTKSYRTDEIRGIREEKGILIGVVKENTHPTRSGVLSVFIPTFGYDEADRAQWLQVRYCTPFFSRTNVLDPSNTSVSNKNPSGFIYPCPDIGTRVLVFFPEGRTSQGYWFACVPDIYMLQGLPESSYSDKVNGPAGVINDKEHDVTKITNFFSLERNVDTHKLSYLTKQGLQDDMIRGISSSSYTRESPSEIIGITSKGRRINRQGIDLKEDSSLIETLRTAPETLSKEQISLLRTPLARNPGHAIILDDGDLEGNNHLIRIRSANGHQILLHDTEELIYIGNSSGTVWIQLSKEGQVDVFAEDSVNVRSKNINFHADENIKFHAGNTIQMVAEQNLHLEGGSLVNLYSDGGETGIYGGNGVQIKSGGSLNAEASGSWNMKASAHINIDGACIALAAPAAGAQKYNKAGNSADGSTVDRKPSHEPYSEHEVVTIPTPYQGPMAGFGGGGRALQPIPPATDRVIKQNGLAQVLDKPNTQTVSPVSLLKQPESGVNIGALTGTDIKRLLASTVEQIGSNFDYSFIDVENRIGKYALNVKQLQDFGYVKPEIFFEQQLSDPRAWTGKDGINSIPTFQGNTNAQEQLQTKILFDGYQKLLTAGAITNETPRDVISGLLSVTARAGIDDTIKFIEGEFLTNRVELETIFQKGVSAITV